MEEAFGVVLQGVTSLPWAIPPAPGGSTGVGHEHIEETDQSTANTRGDAPCAHCVACVGHGIAGARLECPDVHRQVVSGKVDVLDTWSSTFPAGWLLPPFLPSLCVAQARFSQLGWRLASF